jgi:site-specific DNA-methyltransferase (adenine-specific)
MCAVEAPWALHLGDCLDPAAGLASLPDQSVDVVITDPVWPNRPAGLWPDVDAHQVFGAACSQFTRLVRRRVIVLVGCDTDPRFLGCVPAAFPFVRVCWLRYALPSYNATVLNGAIVAYVFGDTRGPDGATLLPGEVTATRASFKPPDHHPCPRKAEHLAWLIRYFTSHGDTVLDPFTGSGTTGVAAVRHGRRFIGWERDAGYHRYASRALAAAKEQGELPLTGPRPRPKQTVMPLRRVAAEKS